MSGWVKTAEEWFTSKEIERLPGEVVLFHLTALASCCRHSTDGHVDQRAVRYLWPVHEDPQDVIRRLLDAGLWEQVEDGWFIPGWDQHILSAEEVRTRRIKSAVTTKRSRLHKDGDHSMCTNCWFTKRGGDTSPDASVTPSVTGPVPNRTEPSRSGPEALGPGRGSGDRNGQALAAASPTSRQMKTTTTPHVWDGDCCPLPAHHPTHNLS